MVLMHKRYYLYIDLQKLPKFRTFRKIAEKFKYRIWIILFFIENVWAIILQDLRKIHPSVSEKLIPENNSGKLSGGFRIFGAAAESFINALDRSEL